MAIAPVLKTGARKGLGVRVPHPPFHSPRLQWAAKVLPLIVCAIAFVSMSAPAQQTKLADAVKIADSAVGANPQDAKTLNMAWRVYLAASQFEKALRVGETMIRADTALADSAFFIRSAAAARMLDPKRGVEMASRGLAKFPHNLTLLIQRAMNAPDSLIAAIRFAASKGGDMQHLARIALEAGTDMYKAGNAGKSQKDLQRAVDLLLLSNELEFSSDAMFLAGASAFQLGMSATNEAETRKDCNVARLAQKSFRTAQQNLPAGRQSYPDDASRLLKSLSPMIRETDRQVDRFCVNARARN